MKLICNYMCSSNYTGRLHTTINSNNKCYCRLQHVVVSARKHAGGWLDRETEMTFSEGTENY
jgi:hypothetical protein